MDGWLTVEVEGMADASEDDAMRDLCQEMVLEEGIIYLPRRGDSCWDKGRGFEADELGDGNGFFESGESAGR